ncbi:MAG: Sec-independent protein translocase protein TatB [Acidimicrobiia bacterium]|nr:Sec-independent protein translocase protein TatB [Acidimicrobiia bacterium]
MPDINFGEWMIIALIALIVVGPRNLPDLSRKLGGWMREARAMATDFRVGLEREIAELDEVRSDLKDLGSEVSQPLMEIKDELGSVPGELKPLEWTGPVAASGPTPDDSARDFNRIHRIADGPDAAEPSGISAKRAAKNEAERNRVDEGPAAVAHTVAPEDADSVDAADDSPTADADPVIESDTDSTAADAPIDSDRAGEA